MNIVCPSCRGTGKTIQGECRACYGTGVHKTPEELATSMQQRYEEWRATRDGQEVYKNVRWRAFRLRERGWRHFGIKALWEAARYDRALEVGPDAEGYKINNNWTSRIARDLMENEPDLVGFFELRELKS